MKVGDGRAAAVDWVRVHAPDAFGGYFSGSTVGMPDDAELPEASDVDVVLVLDPVPEGVRPGKMLHRGAVVEVSWHGRERIASAEKVLGTYALAHSFRVDSIFHDPSGELRAVQERVGREFADPGWVWRRCEDALALVESRVQVVSGDYPQQVMGRLFGAGGAAHVLLVAALANPTVRLRYPAVRPLVPAPVYEELLAVLGCAAMTAERVRHHLAAMTRVFDVAAGVGGRTRFFFSGDISPQARHIAVDGSRALVERGDHREAVFWIVATYARCMAILAADAPSLYEGHVGGLREVVDDLGGLDPRRVLGYLPRLRELARARVAALD